MSCMSVKWGMCLLQDAVFSYYHKLHVLLYRALIQQRRALELIQNVVQAGFMILTPCILPSDSVTRAKGVLTRVMRLAQRYLLDPMGRQRAGEKASQTQTRSRQRSPAPGRVFRSRTSASLTQAQVKLC